MRDIKFRAWNGFTMIGNDFCLTKEGEPFYFGTEMMGDIKVDVPIPYGKADLELMQFTGLLDKQGKEIYEGDILGGQQGRIYQIIYCEEGINRGSFVCQSLFYEGVKLPMTNASFYIEELQIIGNIYENPELTPLH